MQLSKRNIYDRIIMGIAAFLWVLGLLAAGSDSIYMPWLNAVGAILFLVASIWLGRVLPKLKSSVSIVSFPVSVKTKGALKTNFSITAMP